MGKLNKKQIEKLKKKKVWPSILLLVIIGMILIILVSGFVELFAAYIIGAKVAREYDESVRVAEILQMHLSDGYNIRDAVPQIAEYLGEDGAICVFDKHGNVVVNSGNSMPIFDREACLEMEQTYYMYGDSQSPDTFVEDGFAFPVKGIIRDTLKGTDEAFQPSWLKTSLYEHMFWVKISDEESPFDIYMLCKLEIFRKDTIYVVAAGGLALVILAIPLMILFFNTISTISNQKRMTKLLYLDTLTGGNNWLYFTRFTSRIFAKRRYVRKTFAIVNLHFEHYQNYCACYGVKAGEEYLEQISNFLQIRAGKSETFARYGGADFGLFLLCNGNEEEEIRLNCENRICGLLAELSGIRPEQNVHFHTGVCLIPPDMSNDGRRFYLRKNVDVDQLYNFANAARESYQCQSARKIAFFNKELLEQQQWIRKVEDTMEEALRNEEFHVYLQPKYSPIEKKLVGAEALVRWINPSEGFISPGKFIPVFEENGFITKLDDYMISKVARLQAEWMIAGQKVVPISVNVSRAHFAMEGLAEHICNLVDAYGPRHDLIELEVTESAFFDDKDVLVDTVKKLKTFGFHVSMDDFGAGYSSLNSLKDMPLDVLKLDGEFFRGDENGNRGEIVVKEAIQLARNLQMRIVAEGVEKKEQVDFLAEQGCDMIQGFYFAKPMPIEEFVERVERDA